MVKVIKLGTRKILNFHSAYLAQLFFVYLGENRITHYRSSTSLPCVSFFNYILIFFELECATNDCKVIFFSKFSCFFDKCFKLINSTVDGFCKMEINFIIIIWSTNRNIVNKYSFYCFFFINISNITTTTVIFGFILLLFYF